MSVPNNLIYPALAAIAGEIGAITKSKTNTQQGFKYRGIDDVMNVMNPLFSKHQVFAVPEVLDRAREERTTKNGGNLIYTSLTIRYTFYASDGSSVAAVVVGEGMDSGDKSTNKAMAVAMKYAMFQVFCIPTEEMTDPDSETPPPSTPKSSEPKPAPVQAAKSETPASAPVTRASLIADCKKAAGLTDEQFAAIAVRLRGKGEYANKDILATSRDANAMTRAELDAALSAIASEAARLKK